MPFANDVLMSRHRTARSFALECGLLLLLSAIHAPCMAIEKSANALVIPPDISDISTLHLIACQVRHFYMSKNTKPRYAITRLLYVIAVTIR